MAKANWLVTNPSSGSGNGSVKVSSNSEHTGRVARTTVVTFKAANVDDVPRTVNQAGKPEYVDIDDSAINERGQDRDNFWSVELSPVDILTWLWLS